MKVPKKPKTTSPAPTSSTDIIDPELVFGLVGPLGSSIDITQEALHNELRKVGYTPILIHLTKDIMKLIPELNREDAKGYQQKIELMNEIVAASGKEDFLARAAVAIIAGHRKSQNQPRRLTPRQSKEFQAPSTAYIIRQLKRRQEVDTLRKIYGKKFIQISIVVGEEEQQRTVEHIIGREDPALSSSARKEGARRLILRDQEEFGVKYGQRIASIHYSGDVFVAGSTIDISRQVSRFINALFGSNRISPTKDELGSQLAKTASLRTLDLSRQVGAAIMSPDGDIITLGCNEVPKPFGGNYWGDDTNPRRDVELGVEPNKFEMTRLIHNFIHALSKVPGVQYNPKEVLRNPNLDKILSGAFVSDITEYGRVTHAEMSALADAARLGRATLGATIYVTTFPCHNCAKHLVAAGIRRIVYIEPYSKSKALELSSDAISVNKSDISKVTIEHFVGISPLRYQDIFEKPGKRRDDDNRVRDWHYGRPTPMINDKSGTHTLLEMQALDKFDSLMYRVRDVISERAAPTSLATLGG